MHAMYGVRPGNERIIGRIAGFLGAVKAAGIREYGKRMLIRGGVEHEVGRAESPTGFVKVLENALNRMELVLGEKTEHLARTEKRMADILVEVAKPFDKAERLAWLQLTIIRLLGKGRLP